MNIYKKEKLAREETGLLAPEAKAEAELRRLDDLARETFYIATGDMMSHQEDNPVPFVFGAYQITARLLKAAQEQVKEFETLIDNMINVQNKVRFRPKE